jgi:hypothetical protein
MNTNYKLLVWEFRGILSTLKIASYRETYDIYTILAKLAQAEGI